MALAFGLLGGTSATFQDAGWLILLLLFAASIVTVLTWLVQYSFGILRRSGPAALRHRPPAALGLWSSLLQLGCSREDSGSTSGLRHLLRSLSSFKSFRDNWQKAWIRALNDQACRIGSSVQISFEEGSQLPSTAGISHVTCTEQSEQSMVLCCNIAVDAIQFPVSVTQQSPAAVSMDSYQVTLAPLQAQMEICLEEAELKGLLVTWSFKEPPALSLTVTPKLQRGENDGKADISTIKELIEDTIVSTNPAMLINLEAHITNTVVAGEKPGKASTPPSKITLNAGGKLVVRQLKANISRVEEVGGGELCCVMELDRPAQLKRTRSVTPTSQNPNTDLKWNDELTFELGADTKEMKVKVLEKTDQSENVLLGQSVIPLDLSRRSPSGCQSFPLAASPEMSSTSAGSVSLELIYVEPTDPKPAQSLLPLRTTVTPTKKIEMDRTIMPDGTIVTTVTTIQSRPKLDSKIDSPTRSPSKVEVTEKRNIKLDDSPMSQPPSNVVDNHLTNGLDPVVQTAIRQLTESANKPSKKTPTKRSTLIISGVSKSPIDQEEMALSVGYAAAMDASLQSELGLPALPQCSAQTALESPKSIDSVNQRQPASQDQDEAVASDISERPSVDDVESETGSTGALETRSLKDHKVGFLRSGTKLLFRKKHKQKESGFSHSHDDLSNVSDSPSSTRKKSGSFSRKLIKRFSFKSKSKSKANTNGNSGASGN
ncbi:phospholipid transfer protein C2CD2L isoform X1 [Hypanus sabinus]|uniref:phospholipid transfer protein C2CD2L isoform X1 n=1 Tax=Hypanus sabinus TaxID=79690 RepID=UPI0028C3EC9E|nr:phospholipid transfer protein C2CD2L isoform X1 [Hypanus sabinus]